MKVLLLRPPRYVWPFNSETSAFWQPLGLLCLAAAVRRRLGEAEVRVLDCPGRRMGWRSLEAMLKSEPIDVLGIGEETVSAHEALRAAAMVKAFHPGAVVVAGGTYFAHAIEQTLCPNSPNGEPVVDVIVRGEGEQTFVELLEHIDDRAEWSGIRGLAFVENGRIVRTPARPLIDDLDTLPFAAYDLIDMNDYGRASRNHPGLVSIEHSRGCVDSCSFCILWKHMGRSVDGNGQVMPCWRTKSPARSFEEVLRLYRDFGRRTFGWVDPTFNGSAQWADQWSDMMLRSQLVDADGRSRTIHTAWMRADFVVRDEKLGVLEKLVHAGLRQVMIGVERDDQAGLATLGKHDNQIEICREAFEIFHRKYPQVFTIGTMIFGLPDDTLDDLRRLAACEYKLGMDYGFLMPLTPNPGTAAAEAAARRGQIANHDLASYNFHTPVCRTGRLGLQDLQSIYWRIMFNPSPLRLRRALRQIFLERDARKRRVARALVCRGTTIAFKSLLGAIVRPLKSQPPLYSRKPSWYDK